MTTKEKAVNDYIKAKHNQDECFGFIDGYYQCQKDMATILFNISKLINESEYTEYSRLTDIKDYIKSLNKQD